ncbi:MAG: polyphosphate kinase [Sphingomonadaceae bacterium]|nr:polyphosphate kinase [Sphingomonadaceae bacterium]
MIHLSDYEAGHKYPGDYHADLRALRTRLEQAQIAHIVHKRRAIVIVEGWDAAGKGGAIQRMTAKWDPRSFEVWPIKAPTAEEKAQHFLERFWAKLPAPGEIAIFDRSWYGRVLVERVEGFASEDAWHRAFDEINDFEAEQASLGTTIVKLFFHVTQETQDARFQRRLAHPWKRWKITPEDFRNRAHRGDYLEAMHDMLARTDRKRARWHPIDGNNKKAARIAALGIVADALETAVDMTPPEADSAVLRLAQKAFG